MKAWLQAKISLIAVGLVWGSLIVVMSPLMVVAHSYDKKLNNQLKDRWLYSILIAQDILVNCILGGYFRTTISSEVGNLEKKGNETGIQIAKFINKGFEKFTGQINHCQVSIEAEDKHYVTAPKAITGFTLYTISIAAIIYL